MKKKLGWIVAGIALALVACSGWFYAMNKGITVSGPQAATTTEHSSVVPPPAGLIGYWSSAPKAFLHFYEDGTLNITEEGKEKKGTFVVRALEDKTDKGKNIQSFSLDLSVPGTDFMGTHEVELEVDNSSWKELRESGADGLSLYGATKADYDFTLSTPIRAEESHTLNDVTYSSVSYSVPGFEGPYRIQFLQFRNLKNKAAENALNTSLDPNYSFGTFDPSAIAPWNCRENVQTQKINWISGDLVSITHFANYNCYGPYPDSWSYSHVYDLQTGKEVEFPSLFSDPKAYSYIKAQLITEAQKDSCKEPPADYPEYPASIAFGLREGAIIIQTVEPHVSRACEIEISIPLATLAPYIHAGDRLYPLLHP